MYMGKTEKTEKKNETHYTRTKTIPFSRPPTPHYGATPPQYCVAARTLAANRRSSNSNGNEN